jgi:hypothetical protein
VKGDLSSAADAAQPAAFSEHDADDVAIPRGEIVAVAADAAGRVDQAVCGARPPRLPVCDTLDG